MTFGNFFLDFLKIFFGGILGLFFSTPTIGNSGGIIGALYQMFNIPAYVEVFNRYKDSLSTGGVVGAIACFILVLGVFGVIIWQVIFWSKRLFKKIFGDKVLNQDLIDEINTLKKELVKTAK